MNTKTQDEPCKENPVFKEQSPFINNETPKNKSITPQLTNNTTQNLQTRLKHEPQKKKEFISPMLSKRDSLSINLDQIYSRAEENNNIFKTTPKPLHFNDVSRHMGSEILNFDPYSLSSQSSTKPFTDSNYGSHIPAAQDSHRTRIKNNTQRRINKVILRKNKNYYLQVDEENSPQLNHIMTIQSQSDPKETYVEEELKILKEFNTGKANHDNLNKQNNEDIRNNTEPHSGALIGFSSSIPTENILNQPQNLSAGTMVAGNLQSQQNLLPETTLPQSNLRILSEGEIVLYLRRNIGFFIALSLTSTAFLLNIINGLPIQVSYVGAYCYLIYSIIENTIGTRKAQNIDAWKLRDDLFTAIDSFFGIFGIICLQLKQEDIVPISTPISFPFFITSVLYFFKSNAPVHLKKQLVFWKFLFVLQSFLIASKLDKYLDCDWKLIFLLSWVLVATVFIYFAGCGIYLVILFLLVVFRQTIDGPSPKIQFLGFTWYFLYYGLSVILFVFTFAFGDAYGPDQDFELLKTILWVSVILNAFLAISTIIFFEPLVSFVKYYSLRAGFFGNPGEDDEQPKSNNLEVQVEKKANYFMKLSSTYFLPLNHQILARNKENVLQIRKKIAMFKLFKTKGQSKNIQKDKEKQPISIKVLQQYREDLSQRLGKIPKDKKESNNERFTRMMTDMYDEKNEREKSNNVDVNGVEAKLNLTADDIEQIKKIDKCQAKSSSKDEDLCYLCYERPPNVVFMNCGHGGICYDCAINSVKKKPECVECRSKVVAIHKLDPNVKFVNMIKSYEVSKITSQK